MALTTEQIQALEQANGDIAIVRSAIKVDGVPEWEIAFRRPKRSEYKALKSDLGDPRRRSDAQETLLLMCIVYPSQAEFDRLLDRFPAIPEADEVTKALQEMLGMVAASRGK